MENIVQKKIRFLTIRECAEAGPLGEYPLRQMRKAGTLPGVYSGKKFLVNYDMLLRMLDDASGQQKQVAP